jgi:hypothetical protein
MADSISPKFYPLIYLIGIAIIIALLTFTGNPSHKAIKRKADRALAKKEIKPKIESKKKEISKKNTKNENKPTPVKTKKSSKKLTPSSKSNTSDRNYFEEALAAYESDVYSKLERPADRTDIVIRYYKKEKDQGIVYSLKSLGLYVHERQSDVEFDGSASNTIFYGDSISFSDIEIIAFKLISAGLDLKAIVPSKYHDTWKAHSLEIGYDTLYNDSKSLTLSDIRKKWGNK